MTVPNENGESHIYQIMYFVEFLEMICRVADIKFKTNDLDKNMLHKNEKSSNYSSFVRSCAFSVHQTPSSRLKIR
jgi:hypothetical protein